MSKNRLPLRTLLPIAAMLLLASCASTANFNYTILPGSVPRYNPLPSETSIAVLPFTDMRTRYQGTDMEDAAAPRCIRCTGPAPDPHTMRIARLRPRITTTTTVVGGLGSYSWLCAFQLSVDVEFHFLAIPRGSHMMPLAYPVGRQIDSECMLHT